MVSSTRYRVASIGGALLLTILAILVTNHPMSQHLVTELPPITRRLTPQALDGEAFIIIFITTIAVVTGCLTPLFKPRPQRVLDTLFETEKRVLTAFFTLAAVGYFDYTYRLPRSTLLIAGAFLAISLPPWFVIIRRRPHDKHQRAIVVGDDLHEISSALTLIDSPIVGYVSPPSSADRFSGDKEVAIVDGGTEQPLPEVNQLGGLSRLNEVLIQYDIDTVFLAFSTSDRAEFFGALNACYEHGVTAMAHHHVDCVLTSSTTENKNFVKIDLNPWDWQDHICKRIFDIFFATVSLLFFIPFILIIGIVISIDNYGSIFYSQKQTTTLGETFPVYKFRTMLPESESATPEEDEEIDRITRVGRVLRKTHLDEIPQLWTILTGEMSVVGPQAVWIDKEPLLEAETDIWRKRWFVKPGLTSLAQIHDIKSTDPVTKLRYDLEYIQRQSFWFDLKIVARQIWQVVGDIVNIARPFLRE